MKSSTGPLGYVTASIGAVLIALQGVHAQSSQQQTPAPADATFKVEVNYVEEDVRVVDRAGNVIRGLKSADFQVAEDGRPQKVVAFAAVDIPFVPREQPRDASGPAAAPVEPDVASNAQDVDARLYLILLDDYHIAPSRTAQVR